MNSPGEFAIKPGSVVIGHLHTHQSIAGVFATSLDRLFQAEERLLHPPIRNLCNLHVHKGRNEVAAAFLDHTPGEWLLFLDDDMGFAPDLVDKLLAAADPVDRPVMGGLCFSQKRYEVGPEGAHRFLVAPTIYRFVMTPSETGWGAVYEYPRDEVVQVDATGGACLLIHRSILLGMRDAVGDHWFDPVTVKSGDGTATFSEDLSFCHRLAVANVPVYVNTAAKTSHLKEIYLDEWYWENQPVRTVEPGVVITGTGRSGTGFVAQALAGCGVRCGHEEWFNPHGIRAPGLDVDASWCAVASLDDYGGDVWHQTRHPLKVVRSLLGGELFDSEAPAWVDAYERMRRDIAGYDPADAPTVKALRIVAEMWQQAEKHATRTWRLEDFTPGLLVELADALGRDVSLSHCRMVLDRLGTSVNKHPDGDQIRWADLPDCEDKRLIEQMASGFGYDDLEVD